MNNTNFGDMVPAQESGAKTDTQHTVTAKSVEAAKAIFSLAKSRLQDVNRWHTLCGPASAVFHLTDHAGNEVNRHAARGDHFRINIPAPGTEAGEGSDWVMIEAIDDKSAPEGEAEAYAIRVRPSAHPGKADEQVAHFFNEAATSSFTIERTGNTVTASVHGRNEKPNTTAESMLDKIRNTVVALGAMVGISNPQWKSLVKGLLEHE